jgi:hypothetical protein
LVPILKKSARLQQVGRERSRRDFDHHADRDVRHGFAAFPQDSAAWATAARAPAALEARQNGNMTRSGPWWRLSSARLGLEDPPIARLSRTPRMPSGARVLDGGVLHAKLSLADVERRTVTRRGAALSTSRR